MHMSVPAWDAALVRQLCLKIAVHLWFISAWFSVGLLSPTFLWSPPALCLCWLDAGSRIQLGLLSLALIASRDPEWQNPHLSSREEQSCWQGCVWRIHLSSCA